MYSVMSNSVYFNTAMISAQRCFKRVNLLLGVTMSLCYVPDHVKLMLVFPLRE